MYTLGNIFFGDVPKAYNVNLAQFFFTRAAYPLLGTPVPYAHFQLSRTYFIQGDLFRAVDEGEKELEIHPTSFRTHYILGLTYGYLNLEELAIKEFAKFLEYRPDSWAARNDMAWLQFRIGDIDRALATIEPVVEEQKNNVWVQNTYGTLLMNKGRYGEAKIALEQAQKVLGFMTKEAWGKAYPGNDPRIYSSGLDAMNKSVTNNMEILQTKLLYK